MSWIRENKFLTGFLAVVVIGTGLLGWLYSQAAARHDLVDDSYQQQQRELLRLRKLDPYPDEGNLTTMQALETQFEEKLQALHKQLRTEEIPLQPLSTTEFQDRLRATVASVGSAAAARNISLPTDFYLGFEPYKAALPRDQDAAAQLGRQLKAIELVMNRLFAAPITAVTEIKRATMPVESGAASATAAPTPGRGGSGGRPNPGPTSSRGGTALVERSVFEITFVAQEENFKKLLNDLSSLKEQFYVVRRVSIRNEAQTAPLRADAAAAEPIPTPTPTSGSSGGEVAFPGAAPAPTPTGPALHFIVGEEKIVVALRIEILDFADQLPK